MPLYNVSIMRQKEIIRNKLFRKKGRHYYLTIQPLILRENTTNTIEHITNISFVPLEVFFQIKNFSTVERFKEYYYYYV